MCRSCPDLPDPWFLAPSPSICPYLTWPPASPCDPICDMEPDLNQALVGVWIFVPRTAHPLIYTPTYFHTTHTQPKTSPLITHTQILISRAYHLSYYHFNFHFYLKLKHPQSHSLWPAIRAENDKEHWIASLKALVVCQRYSAKWLVFGDDTKQILRLSPGLNFGKNTELKI